MTQGYAVTLTVPDHLWATTVGQESITGRADTRRSLRRRGRAAWRTAASLGACRVDRFIMVVAVGGSHGSPMLAAETLKPLVDAGTDQGLWPDDDPWHRACTLYMPDPRPDPVGATRVSIAVIPLSPREDPATRLLGCVPGAKGRPVRLDGIGDHTWLTSNMRLDPKERSARQGRLMDGCAASWRSHGSVGAHAAGICWVRYPDSRREYKGDPDNAAESATAMWGEGVALGLAPAVPTGFAFLLADGESAPGTHDLDLLALTTPPGFNWLKALAG